MKIYNNIKKRMESRFTRDGTLSAMLFMVSSKKSESDALEIHIQKMKGDPNVIVIDEPIWRVKPKGTYLEETFPVALGNKYLKSRVVGPNDNIEVMKSQGYTIIDVPKDFELQFNRDVEGSLMDYAGVSSSLTTKFISYDRLTQCYMPLKNPFSHPIIKIGIYDDEQIKDYFIPEIIPEEIKSLPLFIHLDMSKTGDRTGISGVVVMGAKMTKHFDKGELVRSTELIYRHLFSIAIECPEGSEISFEKNRQFIYYLKYLGFNIKVVSSDGYQSADFHQILKSAGYNAVLTSVDRVKEGQPYDILRIALNEKRIQMIKLELLEHELINLEKNMSTGKVDHPSDGCLIGSTLINTNHGMVPIQELSSSHRVLSYDPQSNSVSYDEFTNLRITRYETHLIRIETDEESVIICTDNHPILTKSNEFVRADKLSVGDMLNSVWTSTTEQEITNITYIDLDTPIPVYDIEVPSNSNFILANGLVVHNSKDVADSLCLKYDTKLFLLSGRELTIEELYNSDYSDEWVLACDIDSKSIKPARINQVIRRSEIPDKLYKISLDNGKSFEVTGNHEVLCRNGEFKRADELSVGEDLMSSDIGIDSILSDLKIINISEVVNNHSVYDLQLIGIHNFIIDAGIFVHNCGALYNASQYKDEYLIYAEDDFDSIEDINTEEFSDYENQLSDSLVMDAQQGPTKSDMEELISELPSVTSGLIPGKSSSDMDELTEEYVSLANKPKYTLPYDPNILDW